MDILIAIFIQLLLVVAMFYIFGFLIHLINKLFYKILRPKSMALIYATGVIGVPIHELSHAVMCLVFGHKILEIKLFQIDSNEGNLGYVEHEGATWRQPYKMIGNFFIGIAPLFCGGMLIYLLYFLMRHQAFQSFNDIFKELFEAVDSNVDYTQLLSVFFDGILYAFASMFSVENFTSIFFYLFLAISMCISLHMTLSGSDIKNSLSGLALIVLLSAIVNTVLYFAYPQGMYWLTKTVMKGASFIIVCMTLSVVLSACATLIVSIIKGVELLFKKRK